MGFKLYLRLKSQKDYEINFTISYELLTLNGLTLVKELISYSNQKLILTEDRKKFIEYLGNMSCKSNDNCKFIYRNQGI